MPCYLFTYHAYGSWLPDRQRCYVKRGKGILGTDAGMAAKYRGKMTASAVSFDRAVQRLIIDEALVAAELQIIRCHYLATEPTHLHALLSLSIEREWRTVRAKFRESLTRRLNRELERRLWFSKSPSRNRVKDRQHFEHLVNVYLPRHSGLKWCEGIGLIL